MEDRLTNYGGEEIRLRPRDDAFVARAELERLTAARLNVTDRLSPFSYRVAVTTTVQSEMQRVRELGGTPLHDYQIVDDDGTLTDNEFLITNRVLVTLKDPVSESQLGLLQQQYGMTIAAKYSDRTFLMQTPAAVNPLDVVHHLQADPQVEEAEVDVNHLLIPQQLTLPTGANFKSQWHLRDDGSSGVFPASARCDQAWQTLDSYGGGDVVVAVTDGAFAPEHPDIASKIAGFAYFAGNKLFQSTSAADQQKLKGSETLTKISHGTSCAAVAAADPQCHFSVGVAPGCSLYLVKFPVNDESLVIADSHLCAVLHAIRDKVDVVSSSWATPQPQERWSHHVRYTIHSLAQDGGRRGKGIVFVFAAGNADRPLHAKVSRPVPYMRVEDRSSGIVAKSLEIRSAQHFSNNLVGIDNVVHVAAVTSGGRRARYSNYGDGVMLSAPSDNGVMPFNCDFSPPTATGKGIFTAGFVGGVPGVIPIFGGTSAATPIAAGVAALVISANPELTASDVVSILKQTAERQRLDFTPYRPLTSLPCMQGVEDVSPVAPFDNGQFRDIGRKEGLWSPWFGFGRVDAAAAVEEARRRK